jgi:hypothetical protein
LGVSHGVAEFLDWKRVNRFALLDLIVGPRGTRYLDREDFMANATSRALEATEPRRVEIAEETAAPKNQREYQEWIRSCVAELKKADGLSTADRFFCAAFSLLFAGKGRADLDREIDGTVDAETSEENFRFSLHRLRARGSGKVRTRKYVANYFAATERRNKEKRFHDAVLFLFHEGFTREELHRFAAQAEES